MIYLTQSEIWDIAAPYLSTHLFHEDDQCIEDQWFEEFVKAVQDAFVKKQTESKRDNNMKYLSNQVIGDIASDFIEDSNEEHTTFSNNNLLRFAIEIQNVYNEENQTMREDNDPPVVRTITKGDAFEAADLYRENQRILVAMGIITDREDHIIAITGIEDMKGYDERIKLPVKLLMSMLQIQLETNNRRIKQLVPQGYTPWIPVNDENGDQS